MLPLQKWIEAAQKVKKVKNCKILLLFAHQAFFLQKMSATKKKQVLVLQSGQPTIPITMLLTIQLLLMHRECYT